MAPLRMDEFWGVFKKNVEGWRAKEWKQYETAWKKLHCQMENSAFEWTERMQEASPVTAKFPNEKERNLFILLISQWFFFFLLNKEKQHKMKSQLLGEKIDWAWSSAGKKEFPAWQSTDSDQCTLLQEITSSQFGKRYELKHCTVKPYKLVSCRFI